MSNTLLRRRRMLMQAGGSPTPPEPVHPFSIGANKQVYFSKGNLQWSATGGTATPTTHDTADGLGAEGTWRFAENQWDFVGNASQGTVYGVGGDSSIKCNNANPWSGYAGWIDLFGWGTSGYNSKYPYMTSTTDVDYGDGNNDLSNTNYDWGVYNAIYNPQTNAIDPAGTWRTLTKDEWVYLFNTRSTTSEVRYAKAQVNGVNGLIIVPDNWDVNIYTLNSTNSTGAAFTSNVISLSDWAILDDGGCVFLPASGYRYGSVVYDVLNYGFAYTASWRDNIRAYFIMFSNADLNPSFFNNRRYGLPVRLVRDVI